MANDMKPRDPVTENQNILALKPVKAFIYQDHQAHLAVHMSAMQDPKIQQMVSQSPLAQQIAGAMTAHIAEHMGMEYRKQIEQRMGFALPPTPEDEDEMEMTPEQEIQVSQYAAQAAQQLLQQNMQQAQQQQAQEQAQDPLIQLQQQELQIKMAEQQRKAAKDQADLQLKMQQQQIERDRIAAQQETEGAKIAVQTMQAKNKNDREQESLGAKLAIDLAKSRHTGAQRRAKRGE